MPDPANVGTLSTQTEVLDTCDNANLIEQSGAWHTSSIHAKKYVSGRVVARGVRDTG
jgi:hypothetical protein